VSIQARLAKQTELHVAAIRAAPSLPQPACQRSAQKTMPRVKLGFGDEKQRSTPLRIGRCQVPIIDDPADRLRQRLSAVKDAWDTFQHRRDRDAVYDYLSAVFALRQQYIGRLKSRRLVRAAGEFGHLKFEKGADPFSALISCTADRAKIDRKTVSKWARALRHVALVDREPKSVKAFMQARGGINGCAAGYARNRKAL
jgi:hypothetical protein